GTKAWENAPSANSRRNKLGIWLASTNTSSATAGITASCTISRTKPVTRDSSVVAPTMAVLRKNARLIGNARVDRCVTWRPNTKGCEDPSGVAGAAVLDGCAMARGQPIAREDV